MSELVFEPVCLRLVLWKPLAVWGLWGWFLASVCSHGSLISGPLPGSCAARPVPTPSSSGGTEGRGSGPPGLW